MKNFNHPFHMVTLSPWPIMLSFNIMNLLISLMMWINYNFNMLNLFILNILIMNLILFQWWRDVIRESLFQGFHTFIIMKMMKFSMILFIISEIFFFISFFWTYIHSSISISIEIGFNWPPKFIQPFNPYEIPLLNSLILISSGLSITWAHYSLMNNKFNKTLISMIITIILGFYFLIIQMIEYFNASFCFNDSIFSSIFFMSTGFHGLHIFIGIIFIFIAFMRIKLNQMSSIHHFNFEAASWYWHFVDVIWLVLYIMIYWWMN